VDKQTALHRRVDGSVTQIIDIEQKLIMMVTSGRVFHETEGDRLVACLPTPRVVSRFRSGTRAYSPCRP